MSSVVLGVQFCRMWEPDDKTRILEFFNEPTKSFIYTVMMRRTRYTEWIAVTRLASREYIEKSGWWKDVQAA